MPSDAVIPNQNSEGWKSDAHKNLPGFQKLYKAFPKAKWYIMIDDDTYLLKSNLLSEFSKYNHEDKYYFGHRNVFKGCDGVKKFGDGPLFAHGGAGIILSSGAMKALNSNLDNCINKYKTCYFGDVKVGLCLRDIGIFIKNFDNLLKEPPHMSTGRPPCENPLSFHHLLPAQIQEIWDVESEMVAKNISIRMENIYPNFYLKEDKYIVDADLPGSDIYHNIMENSDICRESCIKTPKCVSFTFWDGKCWLKHGIPVIKNRNGSLSGIIFRKYKCNI